MPKETYWIREKGQVKGPIPREELLAMRASGQLNRFHRISRDKVSWFPPAEIDLDSVASLQTSAKSIPHFVASTQPPQIDQAPPDVLTNPVVASFPVGVLLYMHYTTLGLFTFFWIPRIHGKLPSLERDDMTARQALMYVTIPFVNLAWGNFIVFPQLCRRINSIRSALNLRGTVPVWFAISIASTLVLSVVLMVFWLIVVLIIDTGPTTVGDDPTATRFFLLPGIGLAYFLNLVLIPIFAARVQSCCNQISEAQIRLLQNRSTP